MTITESWLHPLIPSTTIQLAVCTSFRVDRSRSPVIAKDRCSVCTLTMTDVLTAGLLLITAVLIRKLSWCYADSFIYAET